MMLPPTDRISVLFSEEQIAGRVQTLADTIAKKLPNDLMLIALLRGSFVFTADLIRALHRSGSRPQVDFMALSSYGTGTKSSGNVVINRDITESVEGRDVLIVDDILETGGTLYYARSLIKDRGARSLNTVVLLDKKVPRKADINADFVGFEIPDKFVVGYGLDYANYYRELPYIGVVEKN